MASRDAEATLELVLKALELCGQHGVLLSSWAGIAKGRAVTSHVFSAERLPQSWLFPRMAAVVHHAGAGTTGAGPGSGTPPVLTPLAADQPSWARQVLPLGAGSAPFTFQTTIAVRMAEAIRSAVTNTRN